MTVPLAGVEDVAAIWRPVTSAETARVAKLIEIASAKLRAALPYQLDARVALYAADPLDPTGVDGVVVASIVAGMVRRVLVNPDGVQSSTRTVGPYSESRTFGASQVDDQGEITVTAADLALLLPRYATSKVRTLELGVSDRMVETDRRYPYRRWLAGQLPTA